MRTTHGFYVPAQFMKDGKSRIVLNKELALTLDTGNENVAAHEYLHHYLNRILNNSPELKIAFGQTLHNYLLSIDPRMVRNGEFRERLIAYNNKDTATQSEEVMTIFLDALASGSMEYNEGMMVKIGNVIKHIAKRFGINLKFTGGRLSEGKHVYNFIKDFNNY